MNLRHAEYRLQENMRKFHALFYTVNDAFLQQTRVNWSASSDVIFTRNGL